MSETHPCDYATKHKENSQEASKYETDEACLTEKQLDALNNINQNTDIGILKEQNCFNDNNGIASFSNLSSNKNYTYNDSIFSKKDIPLAGLNDIRKVCDEFINSGENEENSVFINSKLDSKEINLQNNSLIHNDKSPSSKETQQKELKGVSKLGDIKASVNMTDSNENNYYAVHIPAEFPFADMLVERKENLHVYTDKEEALKVMKLNKKARFKQFKTRKEAEEFAVNGAEIISQEGSSAVMDNEKVMPFKRPKTEDMIQFRKDIERGDIDAVREKIYENPKYLVSNGDTPSILQEGSRYNSLHVAAKAKKADITRLILDSITSVAFIRYLYCDNDIESCKARIEVLLDLYLNMPDKGLNETPLHLAVKHGAVDVVEVLLSYSECQKNVYNRYNNLPKDIICSRVNGPCEEAKVAIASMLEEQYFIPVLRYEDNSLQPRVGEPFSPTQPLKLESDLLSPRLEIQAYAGPMNKEEADLFKKRWKTPPRCVKDLNSRLSLRLCDTEKGLEKIGRNLATELKVPWKEYWTFLDTFIDISSEQGLQLLEAYLKNRFKETFKCVGVEKEKVGNLSADSSEKILSPISDLCEAFKLCALQDKQQPISATPRLKRYSSFNTNSVQREHCSKKSSESVKNYAKNPLVYVERSCEVFGKRIGAAITSCVLYKNYVDSLKEGLETEVKHLLSVIKSYKEDNRFQTVDFQLIHSRVAAVAIRSLQDVTDKDKQMILTALKEIDWSDGALSDDEDLNYNYRHYNNEWTCVATKQLHCLVKHLIANLRDYQETPQISPSARDEADCQILWAQATPCGCTWGVNVTKRSRVGLKRKQYRNDCECDCDVSPRKIHFEEEKEDTSDSSATRAEESEDHFSTPTSGNSDSEDVMEDAKEIPNTFIFPGSLPSKVDFAVLEAIDKVPLSLEKYPNIYLWRHILQTQPKNTSGDDQNNSSPELVSKKVLNFNSPKSSPNKFLSDNNKDKVLDVSFGSCDSPTIQQATSVEPWERVTGPYTPRRSTRSSLSTLFNQSSPMTR